MSPFSFDGYDDETPLTFTDTTAGGGQGTGGSGAGETYTWDVVNQAGTDVITSGSTTGSLTDAVNAAKAAAAQYAPAGIVVRLNGATVHSEGVTGTGTTPPTQGEGGEASGGGSTGGEAGGSGQEGAVTFKFTLYGWEWSWDSKTGDPRTWTGKASEPVISTTGGYGSAQDALDAGKAIGATNEAVMKVIVESEIPGFAGASFIYTDRLQAKQNAVAKEKETATEGFLSGGGTLVLPPGADDGGTFGLPAEAISMALLALAVVAVGAVVYYGMGANK
jgi:hypothetical protein